MTTMWIGPEERLNVGDKGFLIEISNAINGYERYELRDTPPYTNRSHEPVLDGWCGTYNDTATYGHGMWVVERMAKNGRAFIKQLEGDELQATLEEFGYPDLE